MDIPINVDVICGDEVIGRSTCLIINPINEHITHLVVAAKEFPNVERLVPVDAIRSTTTGSLQLNCTPTEFSTMEPFRETDFIESGKLQSAYPFDFPYVMWPYSMYEAMPMPLERERIPAGEVVIRRGATVHATDGTVGKVDEFLVDPKDDTVSHLVLREGHLWGQKDVTIPVTGIDRIADDGVYLKLDKKAVEALPAIATHRKWM
jgi:hypothetical protein